MLLAIIIIRGIFMKLRLSIGLLVGLISFGVTAQAALNLSSPAVKLLNKLTQNQVTITQEFKVVNGWQGFVVKSNNGGQKAILYVDPSNHYLFAGALISADGTNLTQRYTDQFISNNIAKSANQTVTKLNWISDGSDKAPHKLYVLIDPNCVYCHMIYQSLSDYIAKNQLQVRWVPVGLIKPTSLGKAAHLLSISSSQQQIAALKLDENNFNSQQEEGGISALDASNSANKSAFDAVAKNNAFFTENQFIGTPVMLYTQADGTPAVLAGFIQGKDLQKLINNTGSSW